MNSPSRRSILRALGGLGAFTLIGCGGAADSSSDQGSGSGSGTGTGTGTGTGGSVDASGFAVGSGAFLVNKDYGNPFQKIGRAHV